MAALDRAVALAEVDHVAVRVGEHLHLDVARVLEVALEVDAVVGEELLALAGGALERVRQLVLAHCDAKALAAPAPGRLARDGIADLRRRPPRRLDVGRRLGRAGDDRDAGLLHDLAGSGLGAHRLDRRRGGTDEHQARLVERPGEVRVLGEEAIARVDRLRPRLLRDLDDPLDIQVALGRRRRPQQVRLIGEANGRSLAVGLRVDADGPDAHLAQRAHDANRDLAAIRDQDLLEHGGAVYVTGGVTPPGRTAPSARAQGRRRPSGSARRRGPR